MDHDIHVHIHVHEAPDNTEERLAALEGRLMSVESDLVTLTAEVTEFIEDVNARVAALEAAQGEFTVAGRAAFDALKATVDGGVAGVGDADADGNPAPTTP
jgi:F0F1-type ATP synthase epsilon subunit